ncbi:MAG: JAB domain-containing protein [Sphingosinicella sp.]|uniref:JAB domain-containing protein n=1 Tax=Sphingosinicella sp. TaxID=1917971 RepID=UPI00403782A9
MQIATARQAANLVAPLFSDAAEEKLVVLLLDDWQRQLAIEEHDAAGPGAVDLPLRAIFKRALALNATGLVIAHNHPSGDLTPSEADIQATRRLAATAEALGIRLHDHLIFAAGECASFRALGLL